jgi:hypothetical protein
VAPATFSRCVSLSCLSQRQLNLGIWTFNVLTQHNGCRLHLRCCILVLNQGRNLPPLSFLTSQSWPLSCTHATFFLGNGCFSEVCPASPIVQGIDLTPHSAEPGTMTTHPLRGSEATTTQLRDHSGLSAEQCRSR